MRLMGLAILLLTVAENVQAAEPAKIAVTFDIGKDRSAARLTINGLPDAVLKACAARDAKSPEWEKAAHVQIGGGSAEEIAQRPAILGTWKVADGKLCFEPRFPFLPGTAVRVALDPALLADPNGGKNTLLVFDLTLPQKDLTPATKVTQIFPTRKELPENQLRFYIHFSQPMRHGEAYEHLKLLDAKGKPIEDVFLEIGEELWDPTMTRFTLLFHPGRVKKGLVPREELGPILEAGKSYTLVISGKWHDAEGRILVDKEYRKEFKAGAADEEPIDPKKWKITPPNAGNVQALQVKFNEPLDHALLHRVVWVVDADGKKVPGQITVAEEETLWKFTPEQAWQAGTYRLVAEVILEDLAANRIDRPFEVDVFRPIPKSPKAETVELPFEVKAK